MSTHTTLGRRADPIVAIATAPGRGAVGIVRASGRDLSTLIAAVCGRRLAPREATLLPFLGADGRALDQGLALHFPAPHSYTGEDVLELQAHGGPVLLQLLLARCLEALPGARLAQPGEFTERAFLNDKLDLAQAEAVADLIDASTETAARSAGRALAGEFSQRVDLVAQRIVGLRTLVEATLDFPEEEIDFLEQADARGQLTAVREALRTLLDATRQGALLREGLRVVIAGQPNVGKSSLLNALAGAELAIVTPIPGTTRDRLSESIQIEGVPLHVTDTAGLRDSGEAADEVERIGIGRSWGAIETADLVLFVHDLARAGRDSGYDAAERDIAIRLPAGVTVVDVWNKADLAAPRGEAFGAARDDLPGARREAAQDLAVPATRPAVPPGQRPGVRLSARTGAGLQDLRQALLQAAGWHAVPEGLYTARARHVQALQDTALHLEQATVHLLGPCPALDLLAEELRLAHQALGGITGVFSTEDLLGEIFGRFCIGK
jgi:tRNA modification GTPase